MTNRLELNWKLDGLVDEQRYYCSETHIDINNLPSPKAVLDSSAISYIDYDVVENTLYHIVLSSIRGDSEKFSEEKTVSTNTINYTANYPLIIDSKDIASGESLTLTNVSIDSNGAYFQGTSTSYASKTDSLATTLGDGDFTIEFIFKSDRSIGSSEVLIDNYNGSGSSWQIMLDGHGRATMFNSSGYKFTSSQSYLDGQEHHYAIVRKNGVSKAVIDGVVVGTFTLINSLPTKTYFSLGTQFIDKSYPFKGWIRGLKICREALYGF